VQLSPGARDELPARRLAFSEDLGDGRVGLAEYVTEDESDSLRKHHLGDRQHHERKHALPYRT
jgi:hypothetical protein